MPEPDYYNQLLARADRFMAQLLARHPEAIACREGCSACCRRHLTLFPVEAARMDRAIRALPLETRSLLAQQREARVGGEACPLLVGDRCAIYPERPLICRTHGAPLLIREEAGPRTDVCPLNFSGGGQAIPGQSVLDLDQLNEILVAVNVYWSRRQGQDPAARSSITRILACALEGPAQGEPL